MGLDFSKPAMTTVTATAGQTDKNEIAVVEQYDIVADRQQMNQELVNSEEVDRIVSTIWILLYLSEQKLLTKFQRHQTLF